MTSERQTFYCVPIPGESLWVKEISFIRTKELSSLHFGFYQCFDSILLVVSLLLYWFLTAQNSYAGTSQARVVPSTSYVPNRHKRSYEEDDEMDTQSQQMKDVSQGMKEKWISIQYVDSFKFVKYMGSCSKLDIFLLNRSSQLCGVSCQHGAEASGDKGPQSGLVPIALHVQSGPQLPFAWRKGPSLPC